MANLTASRHCYTHYRSLIVLTESSALRHYEMKWKCLKKYFLKLFVFKIWRWDLCLCWLVDSWLGSFPSVWARTLSAHKNCAHHKARHSSSSCLRWASLTLFASPVSWQGLKFNPSGHRIKNFFCLKGKLFFFFFLSFFFFFFLCSNCSF
jgi:hypothetical protein